MERLEYNNYGGPEVTHLSAFALPNPRAEELVVRVAAASINPMDWKIRNGDMKMMTGSRFPRALGTDFAGTVEAVGSNVSRFKLGDAVCRSCHAAHRGRHSLVCPGQEGWSEARSENLCQRCYGCGRAGRRSYRP
jgi:NADPH:quinone reductase-like Zn-dependent oxidoreductase